TTLTSSVFTLAAISCDRFFAILYPLRSRVTKKRTGLVITLIWIISALVSLPFLFVNKQLEFQWRNIVVKDCVENWPASINYDSVKNSCVVSHPLKTFYYFFATVCLFIIPICIMTTSYSLIVWKLWVNEIPGERSAANITVQHRAKKKVEILF
ncbi:neuropeptide FF receptor 2-like protein, partial [Dinothrombium tinctorium]